MKKNQNAFLKMFNQPLSTPSPSLATFAFFTTNIFLTHPPPKYTSPKPVAAIILATIVLIGIVVW